MARGVGVNLRLIDGCSLRHQVRTPRHLGWDLREHVLLENKHCPCFEVSVIKFLGCVRTVKRLNWVMATLHANIPICYLIYVSHSLWLHISYRQPDSKTHAQIVRFKGWAVDPFTRTEQRDPIVFASASSICSKHIVDKPVLF